MKKQQSYILSVSAGTGCFRHIRIDAESTLSDLNDAILCAFEIPEHYPHAFFMDNRCWGRDGYGSDPVVFRGRSTATCSLRSLGLKKNSKFKYLYSYQEELHFQIKVLQELDEPTFQPYVTREKGPSPLQSASQQTGQNGWPELYPESRRLQMRKRLNIPNEIVSMLYSYFDSMARFYGIIPLNRAFEIINSQLGSDAVREKDFLDFCEIVRHEEQPYAILGEESLFSDGEISKPMDRRLIAEDLYDRDFDDIYELMHEQQDKPYYVPDQIDLLEYSDRLCFDTAEDGIYLLDLLYTIIKGKRRAETAFVDILNMIRQGVQDAVEVIDLVGDYGADLDQDSIEDLLELFCDIASHCRLRQNCGYTPEEMHSMVMADGKSVRNSATAPGFVSMPETREWTPDDLYRQLQELYSSDSDTVISDSMDMAGAVSVFNRNRTRAVSGTREQSGMTNNVYSFQTGRKIADSDLCPCGSGKTYGNCCGKKE